MSLDVSLGHAAWHKTYPPFGRVKPKAKVRMRATATMVAETAEQAEPNMSELLHRVGQTRDIEQFEVLFKHFAPRVKAYMARSGSPLAAEELMQETMVAVWNKAVMYDPSKGAASTWIFSIARNLRIDAWRREKRPEYDENDPALQPAPETAADVLMEGEQSAEQIRKALGTLPPDQAEVLRLAFFEDNSQSEIAETLAVPLGTVKSRMRLAFAKLRTVLAGEQS